MKTISYLLIGFFLTFFNLAGNGAEDEKAASQASVNGSLIIKSAPELMDLAKSWTEEFRNSNNGADISLVPIGEQPTAVDQEIILVAGTAQPLVKDPEMWKMVVGRDAVVPVINSANPFLSRIKEVGINGEKFHALFKGENITWGALLGTEDDAPVSVVCLDDIHVKESFAAFARVESESMNSLLVAGATEILSAVNSDKLSIGLCRLTDVPASNWESTDGKFVIMPIDKNRNGKMDEFEKIYSSLADFTRGIWIGKYPAALSGNIYAVMNNAPENEVAKSFLAWLNEDGQKVLGTVGFSELLSSEKTNNLESLNVPLPLEQAVETASGKYTWLIVLGILVVSGVAMFGYGMYKQSRALVQVEGNPVIHAALTEESILAPAGLMYDKTHTWAFMEKDGNVRVGLDDFMQHITGQITRVVLKNEGESIRKGEKFMSIIRDGKQLDIYSPISGTIKQANKLLASNSSLINEAPHAEGWVYMVEPRNWFRESQFMLMGDRYKDWLTDEFTRLKDFIAASVYRNARVYEHVVLQDGGEITDQVLADLGPEVWEDFQTNFIDVNR